MKVFGAAVLASILSMGFAFSAKGNWHKTSVFYGAKGEPQNRKTKQWYELIESLQGAPMRQRLARVNSFFNQLSYRSDRRTWGQKDYWASPTEFLAKGMGDCEDYAIAKYITLRKIGVPEARLKLAFVRHLPDNQPHVVLLVKNGGKQWVLDNINDALRTTEQRTDLQPVYAFGDRGLWLLDEQFRSQRIGGSARLSKWVALKKKTRENGIWLSANEKISAVSLAGFAHNSKNVSKEN